MATFEKLENNEYKFDITIPADEFAKGVESAYRKTAKRFNIPGFRKGKAPRRMIEKQYGEAVFYEDAFDEVYWDHYAAAVTEAAVTPVDSPKIVINQIGEGQELVFSAQVPVKPEVVVESSMYKGIEIPRREYTVTDDQVNSRVESERERLARYVEVERPIENGDRVLFDYAGTVDGVAFQGGTAERQTLDIGSGRFIPGFEDQMLGLMPGGSKTLKVKFPDDYGAQDLAGKEADFAVTVHEIRVKELPDLDDEFAKDVSEFDTLDEYKADIRATLEKNAQTRALNETRDSAIDAVVKRVPFDVPAAMVKTQAERQLDDLAERLKGNNISLEDYFSYIGTTEEQYLEQSKPSAESYVRAQLILEAIVHAENIQPSDEDMAKDYEEYAKASKLSVEEFKEKASERMLNILKDNKAVDMAIDLIVSNASFVEPVKEPDNADAKDSASE